MNVTPLELKGLLLIELKVHRDNRGFFVERFNKSTFEKLGLKTEWFQDNHSRSVAGVVRGLHYQTNPGQGKLVGALRGRIWDVVVDIRHDSPTFGKHLGIELSDENGCLLWLPPGFAHGFCVLGNEPADVMYKVDASYNPAGDGGIRWDDTELGVKWPIQGAIVSERDQKLPSFSEYKKLGIKW